MVIVPYSPLKTYIFLLHDAPFPKFPGNIMFSQLLSDLLVTPLSFDAKSSSPLYSHIAVLQGLTLDLFP